MGLEDDGESGLEVISSGVTSPSCGFLLGSHFVRDFLSDNLKQILGCKTGNPMSSMSPW